jgi:hypothetical protein
MGNGREGGWGCMHLPIVARLHFELRARDGAQRGAARVVQPPALVPHACHSPEEPVTCRGGRSSCQVVSLGVVRPTSGRTRRARRGRTANHEARTRPRQQQPRPPPH